MAKRRNDTDKAEIVRISAALFAEKGFHGTGMTEVCEAVGLGRGAVYYWIRSKEELLYEISVLHLDVQVRAAQEILAWEAPAPDKLRALAHSLMKSIIENLPEWTVFNRDFHGLSEPRRGQVLALRDEYESSWQKVLEQGVREGHFVNADSVTTKLLLGLFNYTYLWVKPGRKLGADDIAERALALAVHGIAGSARHPVGAATGA